MGCAVCSSTTVCRAVELATQFHVCSDYVACLDRLKAVFSNEWGYDLDSLPGHSGRSNFKTSKVLYCHNSSWPTPPVPFPNKATNFALQTIISDFPSFSSSIIGLHSFMMLLRALLVRWGQKTLFPAGGAMSQLYWLSGRGTGHSRVLSISQIGSLIRRE